MQIRHIVFAFILILNLVGLAQNLAEMREKYPDDNACNMLMKQEFVINLVNDKIEVKATVTQERMYLNDKVSSAIKDNVSYSSFFNLLKLEAATFIPKENGKYKKISVKEFSENTNTSRMAFYDDSKEKVFYYTGVEAGAKTWVNYELDVTQPNLLPAFFLQSYYPTERFELTIAVHEDVELGYKMFNMSEGEYTFEKVKKGNMFYYSWLRTDVKELKYESNAPNPKYFLPQVHPFILSHNTSKGKVNNVGTIDNLHAWYRTLIVDYDKESDSSNIELEGIVDSLLVGLNTDKEKVQKIYEWVQGNIQYIAFEYALSGFVPRPATKVCSRRFGDCKDMSSIIKSMCDIADIKSYLTWIGTTSIPFKYDELATPSVDNHMITTYFDDNGRAYFLDATDKYITFGDASSHIQGKQALVSLSSTAYKIVEVPEGDKQFSQLLDTAWISVEGKKIVGRGRMVKTGYYRNYSTYRLVGKNEKEELQYFKSVLEKGSNKFTLKSYELQNLADIYKPLDVTYTFEVDDYNQSYEDEVYVDMNLYTSIGTKIEEDRALPVAYTFKKSHHETYILEIPDGYEVDYVPEDFDKTYGDFHYSITYTVQNNTVIYNILLDRDVVIMGVDQFEGWNDLCAGLIKMFSETVVLKKSN
ncbi:MAG: hypothetical protein ACI9JN_000335 [Bacteroidia bacterium]|jgi:hypothetical protein